MISSFNLLPREIVLVVVFKANVVFFELIAFAFAFTDPETFSESFSF